jgi:hypothetical protein
MQSNNEESESAESAAQLGRDMATFGLEEMIDQLFASEEQVKSNMETRLFNEVNRLKTHLVDLLDATIRNDSKMKESDHPIKLKHIISKLKKDIPKNFQEA